MSAAPPERDPDLVARFAQCERRAVRLHRIALWVLTPYMAAAALFGWALVRLHQMIGSNATFVELTTAGSGMLLCHWVPAVIVNHLDKPAPDVEPWSRI